VRKQPKKQCAAVEHGERCPLDVHAGDYCNKHYRRLQLNGTLEARPMGSIQTCQADENGVICGRPAKHKGLGLCTKHYGRYVRHGTTVKPPRVTECQYEIDAGQICGRPVKSHERCHMHLMRVYRLRDRLEFEAYAREHSR
jgi:hypothetical protein